MDTPPKVSVVLPCYNGADTLAVQLEALARQTYRGPWEIVFVDNGSTDASLDILRDYRPRLPDVRIVNAWSGQGPRRPVLYSYAMGFAAARGDAFVTAESDDEADEGYVAAMAEALEAHPFVAAALDYQKLNPAEFCWGEGGQQTRATGLPCMSGPLYLPFASGCALGMTREAHKQLGDPSPDCVASWDVDYSWSGQLAGAPLVMAPAALMHYRLRTNWRDRYRQGKSYGRGHAALGLKYGQSAWRFSAYWLQRTPRVLVESLEGLRKGRRSWAYHAWYIGFAFASLKSIPMMFTRKPRIPQHEKARRAAALEAARAAAQAPAARIHAPAVAPGAP